MDNFAEYMVKKQPDSRDNAKKAGIIALAVLLSAASVFLVFITHIPFILITRSLFSEKRSERRSFGLIAKCSAPPAGIPRVTQAPACSFTTLTRPLCAITISGLRLTVPTTVEFTTAQYLVSSASTSMLCGSIRRKAPCPE